MTNLPDMGLSVLTGQSQTNSIVGYTKSKFTYIVDPQGPCPGYMTPLIWHRDDYYLNHMDQ